MKHLTFELTNKKQYKNAKHEAKEKVYNSQLIQIFTGVNSKKEIQNILNVISNDFPHAIVIGSTTAGEISHAKIYDNNTIISLSLFKKTQLKAYQVNTIDKKSGKNLSKKICSKDTKAAIVLSEGLQGIDYEGFIKGIKKENPQLILAGGLAGDNFALKKTYVFLGKKIYKEGAVAISFSGKKLFADNRYNLNWTPIGKEFTITSSDGNIIKEIDNENAVTIFKRYLGAEIFSNNAASLPNFQMLYKEGNTLVSRSPMTVENNHLIFAGPLKEGKKVQFGFSNASSVISGSNEISITLKKNPAQAIFIYSCIARKKLLGKVLENEFKPFESIAPTAGFFTYGEFYSTTADNALLNCTTTILVLSEEKNNKVSSIDIQNSNFNSLDNTTFQALTHFIKQTSNELKTNMQLLQEYKDVVDESSLVSKTNIDGIITYANNNFCKVSQYKYEELIGSNHNIIRDKNISAFVFKKLWMTILSGKVWKGTLSNRAKDGSIYYVDSTIMPIIGEDGNISEFIAIRQNISKQIEAKNRIQEKEKLFNAIFNNQNSIVLLSSKKEGMINANKKLFHYLDFKSFEDFKSKHDCICNLFLEEEGYLYPSKYPNWVDDAAKDKTDADKKARILTKDGVIRTFNVMVKQINSAYIINLYDITKLEKAIFKANASEQAKTMFLANMSHEIRTPLNGILGFTDILTKKDLDKDAKRFVDIIHKSGETLLNVVNDILDFSKLESGELTLSKHEANLFKEMEAVVSTFASVSKKKRIDYFTYIDTSIPKLLLCDIQRIKQVINNLLSNAIKFTPEYGNVRIKIELESLEENIATINFSIKDSGIGIAEDKISTVFQAFLQADNSISREFGGTGLGLSISNQYINMMNTSIQLDSKIGEGSEFYFSLKLPIIDADMSIVNIQDSSHINITLLTSTQTIDYTINTIVSTYLKAWKFNYKEIQKLDELDDSINILIVCAKLFEQNSCHEALDKFKKLELIYVEDAEESFNCSHKKFHLLEQPMTGSLLFDKITTLTNHEEKIQLPTQEKVQTNYKGNILIAEDNETNQMLIGFLLNDRGINYTIVNNGQKAVEEATKNHYELIFMDISMPIMDGIAATKLLRENNYTKPIVSLSANVIEKDTTSFLEAGIDDTLNKPIIPADLDKILEKYLFTKNRSNEIIDVDIINIKLISKNLGIADENIILKLLNSFVSSVQEIIKNLENKMLNKNILHNIKGLSGNLRFTKLYHLCTDFEKEVDTWDENLKLNNRQLISSHLQNLVKQVQLLNK